MATATQEEVKTKPAPKTKPRSAKPKPRRLPPWRVLLHNDDVHDMLYVVLAIQQITGFNTTKSVRIMITAHRRGLALVLVTHKERAELYQDQFKSKGLTVTIEPAATPGK